MDDRRTASHRRSPEQNSAAQGGSSLRLGRGRRRALKRSAAQAKQHNDRIIRSWRLVQDGEDLEEDRGDEDEDQRHDCNVQRLAQTFSAYVI